MSNCLLFEYWLLYFNFQYKTLAPEPNFAYLEQLEVLTETENYCADLKTRDIKSMGP